MHAKLLIFIFAVYLQYEVVLGQSGWMPSANTVQDPFAWFKPYYQTAGRFYQDAMGLASQFYKNSLNGNDWGSGSGGMPGSGGMSGFGGMPESGGMSGFGSMPGGGSMSGFGGMPF